MRTHLIVILLGAALSASAEEDRREQNENSRDKARQGNQQQLQPNMMMHMLKAQEHLKEAEKERERKNEGRAREEEEKAMIEQMKAQQLQQQMKANEDSAQQNQAGADKLKQNPDAAGKQEKAKDTPVVSLRLDLAPRQNTGESTSADPVVDKTPIPTQELADLSWIPAPTKEEETGTTVKADAGGTTQNQLGLGFDESTKGGGKTPEVTTTQTSASTTTGATGSGGAAGFGGGGGGGSPSVAPASGSLGGGDFWSQMGAMVSKENDAHDEKEGRLHLKSLRGGTLSSEEKEQAKRVGELPGAELGDEAFWKKVGKEPSQCRKVTGRGRQQCLKTARKEFEARWKQAHLKTRPALERKTASAR